MPGKLITEKKDKLAQREGSTQTKYSGRGEDNWTQVQHMRAGYTNTGVGNTQVQEV